SALGLVFWIETEMHERVVALARLHDDVSALAAVAARRTAARNELLPPEGHAAISAVAGLYLNFCLIDKHVFDRNCAANKKASSRRRGFRRGHFSPANLPTAETLLCFYGFDHHKPAHRALVQELDASG